MENNPPDTPQPQEPPRPFRERAAQGFRRLTALDRRMVRLAPEILLVALILAGVGFRFSGNNWSEGTTLNPDELGFNNVVAGISIPSSLGDYFNTRISPLTLYGKYDADGNRTGAGPDPGWVWGQWPAILVRAAAEGLTSLQRAALPAVNGIVESVCGMPVETVPETSPCRERKLVDFTSYGQIRLLGRSLSALADTITLLVLLAIGLRLYNRRIALLATALSALAATQIQYSHFMTIDNFGVMFAALGMLCAVRAAQGGGFRWYALFGCFYGMTLASRPNFAPLGAMILVAAGISWWERRNNSALPPLSRTGLPLAMFAVAVAATVISFRIAQPMSFRQPTGDTGFFTVHLNPDWLERMRYAGTVSSGSGYVSGYPPAEHWANRPAIVTPFLSIVLWGMGLPLGLAAFAGLLWAGYRAYRGREWKTHALPVLFTGGMFLFLGTRWVMEMRYFLVIYPYLCLLAAWALAELWTLAAAKGRWWRGIAGLAVGAAVIGSLAWAWRFSEIYRMENTRLEASRWIYQNFPAAFRLTVRLASGGTYQQGANFYPQEIGSEPVRMSFRPMQAGTVEEISLGHIADLSGAPGSRIHLELFSEPPGAQPLAQTDLIIPAPGTDPRGAGLSADFGPAALEAGRQYNLYAYAVEGGPFSVKGAWFVDEDWDEPLPFNLDGFSADLTFDRGDATRMNIEWPDVEEKRQMMISNLDRSDFVIIQSQRRIWSVCRMPAVYPMTMEYYRALFDGRLGFELVETFQHPFTFGPLVVSDLAGAVSLGGQPELPMFNLSPLAAEESFSVYDHAPVWIFKKTDGFSRANVEAILGAVDLTHTAKQDASQSFGVLNGLMLPQDRLEEQESGGTWSEMFSYEWIWNKYPGLACAMWWLWAVLTGWAALPLVSLAFGGLPDKGYSVAKVAGWLLVAWAVWLLSSNRVPFVWSTIAAVWIGLVVVGGILAWRERAVWKERIRELGKTWLTMEVVFAAFFLFDLALRFGYGDLWHLYTGGEKPMDFSYLNAVLKSTSFPPYDPWFSGGYLNYYYYGFVLVAIPIKMLGTVPSIGYNLALPLVFGTLGLATYGTVWNLMESLRRKGTLKISPVLAGIGAAVMLAVLGNLGEVRFIWHGLVGASQLMFPHGLVFGLGDILHAASGAVHLLLGQASMPGGYSEWYWNASRAIQFPPGPNGEYITDWSITEFPFFTFLYADLHAHLIAMPLIILSLAGSAAMVIAPERLARWRTALPLVALTALAVGSLWPVNGWNYPISLAIAIVGLAFAGWLQLSRSGTLTDWRAWVRILLWGGLLVGCSIWFFQPYYNWNAAGHTSFVRWEGPKTPLDSYLIIHGLFLFIILAYLVSQTRDWLSKSPLPTREFIDKWSGMALACLAMLTAAVVILAALGYQVLALAIPLIFWSIILGLRKGVEDEHRLILGLIAISLAVTGIPEIVVLAGDMDRQNTVFKFYIQAWIFFAVAAGAALGWLAANAAQWRPRLRKAWIGGLVVLVLGAFSYTIFGSYYRIIDRMSETSPKSLDGMAFMPYTTYEFNDEYSSGPYEVDLKETYDAVRWMQENIDGSPVIVQSILPIYRGGLPFTMFTGLPSVMGWNHHQRQQRGVVADAWVEERYNDIKQFYETTDLYAARAFLRKYGVQYIVLSQLERAYFTGPGLDKFDAMVAAGELRVVFSEGTAVIYEVVDLQS
jgi:YYY domain-containing protein